MGRKLAQSNIGTIGAAPYGSLPRPRLDKVAGVTLILALFVAPLTILTLCFAAEVLAGLRPLARGGDARAGRFAAVVIVPAHDEEAVLPRSLRQLADAARGRAAVLVVADNCSDRTAALASGLGAEVIERFDAARRGKGFALDFARQHLRHNPPDVVLIVDADCLIDGDSLTRLIQACGTSGRPCQATNLQQPAPDASPPVQLSTFAFYIKNVVRLRGLERLAGRAHLLGTGMAIPWAAFANAELATSSIVEDLKLGQDLARHGCPPMLVEDAKVSSGAETDQNTLSQRRRWEGGFLQNALNVGPSMLRAGLMRGDLRGVWAALDTMVPPFALLLLLDGLAFVVAAVLAWLTGAGSWPGILLAAATLIALIALGLAWATGGSRFVTLGSLARAPLYVLWKLPMYLSFARQGTPKDWQRTGRT